MRRSGTTRPGTADASLAAGRVRQHQARAAFAAGESDRPTLVTAELEPEVPRTSRFDALLLQRQAFGAPEDALRRPLFDARAPSFAPRPPPDPAAPRPTEEPR